jgi:hypothetical protein
LLNQIGLTNTVITADATHYGIAHARYLHQRGGHDVFTVKTNLSKLYSQLNSLPWPSTPVGAPSDQEVIVQRL